MVAAIACVDEKWGIGKDGNLLMKIPEDMKLFRDVTYKNYCIMGRKTYESIPAHKRPLKDRYNVILSNSVETYKLFLTKDDQCVLVQRLELTEDFLKNCRDGKRNIFVIGGGHTYSQLLKYCDEVYITRIFADLNADVFFPRLSEDEWECQPTSEMKKYKDVEYRFYKYRRKQK